MHFIKFLNKLCISKWDQHRTYHCSFTLSRRRPNLWIKDEIRSCCWSPNCSNCKSVWRTLTIYRHCDLLQLFVKDQMWSQPEIWGGVTQQPEIKRLLYAQGSYLQLVTKMAIFIQFFLMRNISGTVLHLFFYSIFAFLNISKTCWYTGS